MTLHFFEHCILSFLLTICFNFALVVLILLQVRINSLFLLQLLLHNRVTDCMLKNCSKYKSFKGVRSFKTPSGRYPGGTFWVDDRDTLGHRRFQMTFDRSVENWQPGYVQRKTQTSFGFSTPFSFRARNLCRTDGRTDGGTGKTRNVAY